MSWYVPSVSYAPPGGKWFWGDDDHYVESTDYAEAVSRITAAIRCSWGDAERKLLDYVCPRVEGFCLKRDAAEGTFKRVPKTKRTVEELLKNAQPYTTRPDAPANEIMRRMEVCTKCPKWERTFCLGCAKVCSAVYEIFKGRRMKLPGDVRSGICCCADTFDMVVSSVDYRPDDPVWEGTPETCWRLST